jgi:hypothetical protein
MINDGNNRILTHPHINLAILSAHYHHNRINGWGGQFLIAGVTLVVNFDAPGNTEDGLVWIILDGGL